MVTVHRVPVIDSREEMVDLYEGWEDYLEAADEYTARLSQYQEAAAADMEDGSRDVEVFLDSLRDSYDELQLERSWIEKQLEDSSLRGHASYPHLDHKAVQMFRHEYGDAPAEMKNESPDDFYFLIANDFIEREGVEWRVEVKEVDDLDELRAVVESCKIAATKEYDAENPELPDTEVDGMTIGTDVFEPLLSAVEKTDEGVTYQSVAPYERHVFDEYDRSAVEELLGVEMNSDVLDRMESGDQLPGLAD